LHLLLWSSVSFSIALAFYIARVCRDRPVLDKKNQDYTKVKGDMNPKVTRSSLEMLVVNTFRNITEEEPDLLAVCVSASYTATVLILYKDTECKPFLSLLLKWNFPFQRTVRRHHEILAI
jgi:hypothetical protein